MFDSPLAIVDLETTGMGQARDRVIEVGICLVDDGCLTEEWSTLVNPDVAISPFIIGHTGITNEMVRDAPRFADIMDDVLYRLDGRVFVAHNSAFDYGFLKAEFLRHGLTFQARSLCTVKLSRALYPKERRHGLDALIERFGLPCGSRHRALDDARAVWHLLQTFHRVVDHEKIRQATRTILKRISTPPRPLRQGE